MKSPVKQGDVFLDKYVVGAVLGQGGMGMVVAARHVQLGELYAIKFLLPFADNDLAEQRFMREARASAQLKSEHVTRVHDVGKTDSGISYMIMEHLTGSDLRTFVRNAGPLPMVDVIDYALQACDALAEAHANGIIHRDVKSANLFLTTRPNGTACIKLLDFGISKEIDSENVDLTQTGAILGSPLYMSPEQMSRSRNIDGRTDIWSLGIVMYELLSGRPPFAAKTLMEAVAKVLSEELPPLRAVRPELSEDLEAVVTKCLCKNRDDRYLSIVELAEDLERARASKRVLARGVRLTTLRMPHVTPSPATDPETIATNLSDQPLTNDAAWGSSGYRVLQPHPNRALVAGIASALVVVAVGLGLFLWKSSDLPAPMNVSRQSTSASASAPVVEPVLPGVAANTGLAVQPLAVPSQEVPNARPAARPVARPSPQPATNQTSVKKTTKSLYSNDD